nr:FRG domain-containing protein [Pseudoteredinibacter isoporae]
MLFRGQSDAAWGLLSSVFRGGRPLLDFTPQAPEVDKSSLRESLGHHLHAEARSVFLFLESADRMGIPTPIDLTTLNDSTDLITAAMRDEEYDYSEQFPKSTFEASMALAQHNGVPTRLLDWSESPLVACYFAALGRSVFSSKKSKINQEIVVYFMSRDQCHHASSPVSLIKVPKFQNVNLRCQQGMFTNIKGANTIFLEDGAWPDLLSLTSSKFQIQKRRLPASESDDLLRLLYDLDISRESLFPSLANAAASYKYRKALFSNI